MRLTPSDPDIETLLRRINSGKIDLQPDFQRGEVWSPLKQRRLIDTILRNWYVPPIHVIEHSSSAPLEVLDGQQRLAAIRDFAAGKFSFDGKLEPISEELARIDGLYYSALPDSVTGAFNAFPIRLYTIHAFEPGEPAELFFRLNQQVALTAAEQRNAFFGPVRDQIHELAGCLEKDPLGETVLGFGNSRMAYDDVIARVCLTLEQRTLRKKVTASLLSTRYRSKHPFPQGVTIAVKEALELLTFLVATGGRHWRFNKPILHSWLLFLAAVRTAPITQDVRNKLKYVSYLYGVLIDDSGSTAEKSSLDLGPYNVGEKWKDLFRDGIASVFKDRATSRVSDVSSVMYRDMFFWMLFYAAYRGDIGPNEARYKQLVTLHEAMTSVAASEAFRADGFFAEIDLVYGWGEIQ